MKNEFGGGGGLSLGAVINIILYNNIKFLGLGFILRGKTIAARIKFVYLR